MELIKIGDTAIKVSLSKEDMKYFDIEFDMLDYANTETKRVIWRILDEAKRSLGFDMSRDGLYIQAFRSKCGGCELFLSGEERSHTQKYVLFKFSESESMINACARLKNCGYNGESHAYLGEDDAFFLALQNSKDTYSYFDEIALRIPYNKSFLAEHTKLLCSNAVETMAKLR